MKIRFASLALFALASVFAVAQNTPQQKDPQQPGMQSAQQPQAGADQDGKSTASSGDVQNEIQTALQKEPSLAGASITVQASGKKIELSGTVPSKDAKATAEQVAKTHSGGMEIKSHLKVSGGATSPGASR